MDALNPSHTPTKTFYTSSATAFDFWFSENAVEASVLYIAHQCTSWWVNLVEQLRLIASICRPVIWPNDFKINVNLLLFPFRKDL